MANKKEYIIPTGGIVDTNGLHWLEFDKDNPEKILNSDDLKELTEDQKKIIARKITELKNQEKFISSMNNLNSKNKEEI